jgi:hypothetical protein
MAVSSEYPIEGDPIVRGDPLTIPIDISVNGVAQDVSGWHWRAHIRRSPDAVLVTEFATEAIVPPDGTVPSRLLLSLTSAQTALLRTGMVFDLEQLSDAATPETVRTWWICTKLTVAKDVSHA